MFEFDHLDYSPADKSDLNPPKHSILPRTFVSCHSQHGNFCRPMPCNSTRTVRNGSSDRAFLARQSTAKKNIKTNTQKPLTDTSGPTRRPSGTRGRPNQILTRRNLKTQYPSLKLRLRPQALRAPGPGRGLPPSLGLSDSLSDRSRSGLKVGLRRPSGPDPPGSES